MKIGEVARRTGVSTKTIRYYEEIGVLPEAARSINGYRTYGDDAVERLRFIRDAQQTGLTLAEITSILDLRTQGVGTCEHVTELLERHMLDLDSQIEALHRARGQLQALTRRARLLDPAECTDPVRCQTIEAGVDVRASHHARPHKHAHG